MVSSKNLSDGELKTWNRFLTALDVFTTERNTMPVQYIRAFALIVLNEGKTVGEYARMSGVAPSVMSRHIADLGPRTRGMQPGLGLLITKQNYENMREHTVHLTDKGKALAHKLPRNLGE